MLTGKIYKNRLTQPLEDEYSPLPEARQIVRVKSQPGLHYLTQPAKTDMAENYQMGTLKSQRDKLIQEQAYNMAGTNMLRTNVMDSLNDYEMKASAGDLVLEYERKMKDHLVRVEDRHEKKIAGLEQALQAKNEVIAQLRSLLKEKQQIIEKLQAEHLDTHSRLNTQRFA